MRKEFKNYMKKDYNELDHLFDWSCIKALCEHVSKYSKIIMIQDKKDLIDKRRKFLKEGQTERSMEKD